MWKIPFLDMKLCGYCESFIKAIRIECCYAFYTSQYRVIDDEQMFCLDKPHLTYAVRASGSKIYQKQDPVTQVVSRVYM